jgi:6-phosphogluconolactonase
MILIGSAGLQPAWCVDRRLPAGLCGWWEEAGCKPALRFRVLNNKNDAMSTFELLTFNSPEELARAAADAWLDEIDSANRAGLSHKVALSGGRIAQEFFAATVARAGARSTAFDRVHFFWADERCVPPTDPESNFKIAHEILLAPLGIAAGHIHRLRGEEAPETAVKRAETEIFSVAPKNADGLPVLDLILLGMGEDGHVASLFPGISNGTLDSSAPFLVVTGSPKPPPARISLSYRAILAATKAWVLVSGDGKTAALRESLSPTGTTPMSKVVQGRPTTVFSCLKKI